jgi:hypothetical protein
MTTDLGFVTQLAHLGVLNYLEGGNEEDDAYPASLGNTLQITAQFQQQVYATGHALGLPVTNMSFGAGWTAANNWQGDYGLCQCAHLSQCRAGHRLVRPAAQRPCPPGRGVAPGDHHRDRLGVIGPDPKTCMWTKVAPAELRRRPYPSSEQRTIKTSRPGLVVSRGQAGCRRRTGRGCQ